MGNSRSSYGGYDYDDYDVGFYGYGSDDYGCYGDDGGGRRGRYSGRAEKSAAATRREDEATSKFDYLRAQVELATHDNLMTVIGLSIHPRESNRSPLRSLPPDVMRQVLAYAGIDKPKGTEIVKRAARARNASRGAIVPYDGFFEATKAPLSAKDREEQTALNLADASLFQPGSKIVFPLTKPNLHLTGPCYRDLRKHVKRYPRWDVKRTAATPQQKRAYKETRQGKVYFINAVYSVPGKLLRRKGKKAQPSASAAAALNGATGKRKRGPPGAEMAGVAGALAKTPPEQMVANKRPTTKGASATMAITAAAPPAASLAVGRCASAALAGRRISLSPTNPQTATSFRITITKPTRDAKLGIGVAQQGGTSKAIVTQIHPGSVFLGTDLRVGMLLETINGRRYGSFDECLALLKSSVGQMAFVASVPPAPGAVNGPGSNVAASEKRNAAAVTTSSAGGANAKSAAAPSVAISSAYVPAGRPAAVAASSPSAGSGGTGVESQRTVTVVVVKPTKETKLGLGIASLGKDVLVTKIHPHSLFRDTELATNMRIVAVNGASYATIGEGVGLLRDAEGTVTVTAAALPAPAGGARDPPLKEAKTG